MEPSAFGSLFVGPLNASGARRGTSRECARDGSVMLALEAAVRGWDDSSR